MESTLAIALVSAEVPPAVPELVSEVITGLTQDPTATSQAVEPIVEPTIATTLTSALSDATELTAVTIESSSVPSIAATTGNVISVPTATSLLISYTPFTSTDEVINGTSYTRRAYDTPGRSLLQRLVFNGASGSYVGFDGINATKRMIAVLSYGLPNFNGVNTSGRVSYALPTIVRSDTTVLGRDFVGHGVLEMDSTANYVAVTGGVPTGQEANYAATPIQQLVEFRPAALITVQQ